MATELKRESGISKTLWLQHGRGQQSGSKWYYILRLLTLIPWSAIRKGSEDLHSVNSKATPSNTCLHYIGQRTDLSNPFPGHQGHPTEECKVSDFPQQSAIILHFTNLLRALIYGPQNSPNWGKLPQHWITKVCDLSM